MIRKFHNHKPQTNPWHREEEPHNHHKTPGRQGSVQQNIEQLQTPTMGETINKKLTTTEPSP